MGTWTNNDGLYIKFGTTEATVGTAGELKEYGPLRVVEVEIDYTMLATAAAVMSDTVMIPNGARIERIQVVTETAWDSAGDAFVMNLGLIDQDRTTELDYNGFIAALPQASMDPAGEINEVIIGHTYVGALVGTTLSNTGLITADWDTAAPTVGKSVFRIYYYIP